jgi:NADPH:quinone reductase-like Zn-dependent oxidoreductase
MQAWMIYYYGTNQQLTLSDSIQMPVILSPTDVLVKVLTSSVNPIDIRRRGNVNR